MKAINPIERYTRILTNAIINNGIINTKDLINYMVFILDKHADANFWRAHFELALSMVGSTYADSEFVVEVLSETQCKLKCISGYELKQT
jgi:hypothetical protein